MRAGQEYTVLQVAVPQEGRMHVVAEAVDWAGACSDVSGRHDLARAALGMVGGLLTRWSGATVYIRLVTGINSDDRGLPRAAAPPWTPRSPITPHHITNITDWEEVSLWTTN